MFREGVVAQQCEVNIPESGSRYMAYMFASLAGTMCPELTTVHLAS